MSISNFLAQVKSAGLAKSNRYMVVFDLPRGPLASDNGVSNPWSADFWQRNNNSTTTNLQGGQQLTSLYCEAAQMPALNIDTKLNKVYGPGREMPYGRSYTPVNFSFYVDRDYIIKRFFDTWQNSIFDRRTGHVNFYNEYTTQVHILALDSTEGERGPTGYDEAGTGAVSTGGDIRARYQCTLIEAYPKTVAEVAYTAAGQDVVRLNVSMQYRTWQETTRPYGIGRQGAEEPMPYNINYNASTGVFTLDNIRNGRFDPEAVRAMVAAREAEAIYDYLQN